MLDEKLLLEFIESSVMGKSLEDIEPIIISKTCPLNMNKIEFYTDIVTNVYSKIIEELGEESFIYSCSQFHVLAVTQKDFTNAEHLDSINGTYKSGYLCACPIYVTPLLVDEIYVVNKDASKILKFKIVR